MPPQDPSVLVGPVGLLGGAADVLLGAGTALEADEELPHVPKSGLQPVPQWSVVEPQYPYWEQQLPSSKPMQVYPVEPPQEPSGEEAVGVAVGAEVEEEDLVAEGMADVDDTMVPAESRYQFASGSPKHSPTVTPL